MASSTEEQRRILHQTRHEAFTQGEFSQRYDLRRYSSKCLRSLLRMGRRSEYYHKPTNSKYIMNTLLYYTISGTCTNSKKRNELSKISAMCSRRHQKTNSRIIHISLPNQGPYQGQNLVAVPPTRFFPDRGRRGQGQGLKRRRLRHDPKEQH